MVFRVKAGQQAYVHKDCCEVSCDSHGEHAPVLVVARVTVETFNDKHYSYRVITEEGEAFEVKECKLITQKELDKLNGTDEDSKTEPLVDEVTEPVAE